RSSDLREFAAAHVRGRVYALLLRVHNLATEIDQGRLIQQAAAVEVRVRVVADPRPVDGKPPVMRRVAVPLEGRLRLRTAEHARRQRKADGRIGARVEKTAARLVAAGPRPVVAVRRRVDEDARKVVMKTGGIRLPA